MCSPCHPPPSRTTAFLFTPAQATLATAVVRGRVSSTVSWSSTTRAVPFLAFQSLLLLPVPAFRYDITSPPFSNTGIDLFGPVKVPMENDAKAYGVIYVCATSRLVFVTHGLGICSRPHHCFDLVVVWIYEQVRFQSYRWTRAALFYLSAFTLWMSLCALARVISAELHHVISTMREKSAEIHGLSQEKFAEAQPIELIGIIIIGLLFLLLFLLLNKDTTTPSLLRGIPPPLPILEEHSFCKWEKSLRLHLENENLLMAIEQKLPASSRVNRLVLEKITQGVPGHLSAPLKGKDTAFDAFDSLKKEMISRSESLCSDLLEELKSKKLISFEAEAVRKHIEKFNSYANQLTDLGDKTTDCTLLRLLGNTLPADHDESRNKFSVLAQQLNSQGTLASGIDLLKRSCSQWKEMGIAPAASDQALFSRNNYQGRPNFRGRGFYRGRGYPGGGQTVRICYRCKEPGHIATNCPNPLPINLNNNNNIKSYSNTEANSSSSSLIQLNESQSYFTCSPSTVKPCILDSGSTNHYFTSSTYFQNLQAVNDSVTVANGQSCSIVGTGKAIVNNDQSQLTLMKAKLTPGFSANLVSVSQLADDGHTIVFEKNKATIFKDGYKVMHVPRQNGLYQFEENNKAFTSISPELDWHARFGHPGPTFLLNIANLHHGKSPFEQLFPNTRSFLDRGGVLHVFGCLAYRWIPHEKRNMNRAGKFEAHSEKMVFVGYDHVDNDIFLLLNPSTGQVYRERNVVFVDTMLPLCDKKENCKCKCINASAAPEQPVESSMVWAFVLGPTIASMLLLFILFITTSFGHCKLVVVWIYEQVRFQSYRWTRAALFYLSAFTLWMSLCALALFIDAIPDMTAQSVFTSLAHFVARNGLPRMFYSDNGKQLIKVKNDLQQYLDEMALKRPDQEFRVNWQHLTAHSPWKGGFYERLNRSIKEALATFFLDRTVSTHSIAGRVNGKKAKLSLAQLKQVLAEIEGIINNRPFFEHEGKVIRPIDFRAGQGSLQMPIACNLPSRYQKPNIIRDYKAFQTKVNHYRKLWKSKYILELRNFHQHSEKQKVPRRFKVGDIVHVKAPSTRLDQWPLGIVTKVFDSSDGISRSAKVRTLNRGNVVEEMKDVRNLIPVEANQERHEQPNPEAAPEPDQTLDDHQQLDLPDPRLRPTASRVARLRPSPAKKESLEKLARKWTRALQLKQKDAIYRQRLRDLISGSLAKGQPKDSPQVKEWLEELYSMSTDPRGHWPLPRATTTLLAYYSAGRHSPLPPAAGRRRGTTDHCCGQQQHPGELVLDLDHTTHAPLATFGHLLLCRLVEGRAGNDGEWEVGTVPNPGCPARPLHNHCAASRSQCRHPVATTAHLPPAPLTAPGTETTSVVTAPFSPSAGLKPLSMATTLLAYYSAGSFSPLPLLLTGAIDLLLD
ncbi:H/ACA snoRNP pseudouridylase subunit [Tyrophagus putrescentiae]|nr:H/ACA snoRNP pseudouridylase subunit [Tyrophagus putrescentiae]